MNFKGWITIAEKVALIDIAEHQNKTIKNKRQKAIKGLLITANYLYKNGKAIRKQNKKL
jgi:hypothetical protein